MVVSAAQLSVWAHFLTRLCNCLYPPVHPQGIKVGLPAELVTEHTFLRTYVDFLLEYQRQARLNSGHKDLVLPLAIMTSGVTAVRVHERESVCCIKVWAAFSAEVRRLSLFKGGGSSLKPSLDPNTVHWG